MPDQFAVAVQRVRVASAGKLQRYVLRALGRPCFGVLPLVDAHGEVLHLRLLLQKAIVFALEEVIEPCVGEGVVVEAGVPHAAFADDGVFLGARVAAVQRGRDDGVLFVGSLAFCGRANEVVRSEIRSSGDVVPGHEPEAGNVDRHGVGLPESALAPRGIVRRALDHRAAGGVGILSLKMPLGPSTAEMMSFSGRCSKALAQSMGGICGARSNIFEALMRSACEGSFGNMGRT